MRKPPLFSSLLLRISLHAEERQEKSGDLEEEYSRLVETVGPVRAGFWFRSQALKVVLAYRLSSFCWRLTMFKNDLKIALRNLAKSKGYALLNLAGLVIGISAFLIIGVYIQYELSFDTYSKDADRIFRLAMVDWQSDSGYYNHVGTPGPLANVLAEEFPEVESAVRIWRWIDGEIYLRSEKKSILEQLYYASPNVLEFFSIPLVSGDPQTALKEPFSIVISERLAKKYFRNENPIGKVFSAGSWGRRDCAITGVFKEMPANSHLAMDMITPFSTFERLNGDWINQWEGGGSHCYIRLKRGADPNLLERKLPALLNKYKYRTGGIDEAKKMKLFLQPLTSIHLKSALQAEFRDNADIKDIYIFASIGLLILFVAFINYTNLSISLFFRRGKEVAVRKVMGADKSQLVRQVLGESLSITALAAILSSALALLALPVINNLLNRRLNFNLSENPRLIAHLAAMFAVIALACVLSGIYPALILSSAKVAALFKGKTFGRLTKAGFRKVLIACQFSIAIFAIIATMTTRNQLTFMKNKSVGYDKGRIIVIETNFHPRLAGRNIQTLKDQLLKSPEILKVSSSSNLPNSIFLKGQAQFPIKAAAKPFLFCANVVDYDFVDVYGMEIVEGRNFSRQFRSDEQGAVLINEMAAKSSIWESPIGKEFTFWGRSSGTIVGILKDFNSRSLHYPIEPVFFILDGQGGGKYLSLKIASRNIPKTIKFIRDTIRNIAPDYQLVYYFFDEAFDRDYKNEQRMNGILSGFSGLTIVITCLGFLSLVTMAAQQRTKEIGIRKVLGASLSGLSWLIVKDHLKWALLANIVAWPIAYHFMRQWLQNFAYRIDLSVWIFIVSSLATLGIALLTVSYQTIKAASANPADSLRYE